MDADVLRIILATIGIIVIIGIYWWDRFKKNDQETDFFPDEEDDEENNLVETISTKDHHDVNRMNKLGAIVAQKNDEITDVPDIKTPHSDTDGRDYSGKTPADKNKIIVINIVAQDENMFDGALLSKAISEAELQYGDMKIFHRYFDDNGRRDVLFSVANILEPGYFETEKLDEIKTQGLTFFMQLPGPKDGLMMFSDMLYTAQCIASTLNGEILDKSRSTMTKQTIDHMREEILNFQLLHQLNMT